MSGGQRFPFKRLDVYQAAIGYFAWCVRNVASCTAVPFKVRDQILAASVSIIANIAEANGRWKRPGEAEQHYRYAQGSTYESAAFLDALTALEVITTQESDEQEERLAGIAAMLTALMNRQRRRSRTREPGSPFE